MAVERPLHLHADVRPHSPRRRIVAIGVAVILEAGAVYAVSSGLATRAIMQLPQTLKVDIFKPPPPKQITPPPPQAQLVKPSLPTVPPPMINIQTPPPPNQITAVRSPHPVVAQPTAVATNPPPPPPVRSPPVPTPPRASASTHTQPPYPVLARRIGKEGTVLLNITVGTDGSVQNVSIAKSSGDDGLDQAAVNWVREHWKYRPATQNGQPVIAQSEAQVVFNPQQAEQSGVL
jgi:protein TonB